MLNPNNSKLKTAVVHGLPAVNVDHAQGCLLGLLAGSALGSKHAGQSPEDVHAFAPDALRSIHGGGLCHTIPGQPSGTGEMALMLARMLVERGRYTADSAREYYSFWLKSNSFDCCPTVASALNGECTINSQSPCALARIVPLGIFAVNYPLEDLIAWAMEDTEITHPNELCTHAGAIYCYAIAEAIRTPSDPELLYRKVVATAKSLRLAKELIESLEQGQAQSSPDPEPFTDYVLSSLQNAFSQLLHARCLEDGIIRTIQRGGNPSVHASVCGALLGAVYGQVWVPQDWTDTILNSCPEIGQEGVMHPRPGCMWPVDALELAERLVQARQSVRSVVPEQFPLKRLHLLRR